MSSGIMPTITCSKEEMLRLLGKKLSDIDLEKSLAMMGIPVESQGDEWVLEVFPNRPDFLSVEGVVRGLKSFLGISPGIYVPKVHRSKYKAVVDKATLKVRPEAVVAVVKDVDMTDDLVKSLMQVQEKLHTTHSRNRRIASIGLYDLDKVSFPIRYKVVGKDYSFVPLGFSEKMSIEEILHKHPKGIAYSHLAKGSKYVVWEDAKGMTLSFPPVINSEETAVTSSTKNLLIDVTGLRKEAVETALNIITYLLYDRGGKIYGVDVNGKAYPQLEPTEMDLDVDYASRLLGIKLSKDNGLKLLKRMGYGSRKGRVLIPAYRVDILHQIDLVEDIAIAYGYDKFRPEIPNIFTMGKESREADRGRKLSLVLAGLGFLEVNTYHLSSKSVLLDNMNRRSDVIETESAVNQNYNLFRDMILPQLIDIISQNKHHPYPQMLFEIGRVGKLVNKKVREEVHLSGVIADSEADFSKSKSVVEAIARELGVKYSFKPTSHPSFMNGRCAETELGIVGEISPEVLEKFGIEVPVSGFELDVTSII